MIQGQDAELLDKAFAAMGNEHRREIIYQLGSRPQTISQLAEKQGLSLPAIHKHIAVLEVAQLLLRKKSGRSNFLALNKQTLTSMQRWLMQYHTYWGNGQETLDNYVESMNRAEEKGHPSQD